MNEKILIVDDEADFLDVLGEFLSDEGYIIDKSENAEEALKKLESIVETMESGDLPLETLLARYEEGTKLSQICRRVCGPTSCSA